MLKIPTFVLGGLLILTGLTGYFFQAPSLSIKINGALADDAKLTLSDGNQTHVIELGFPSGKESAGDQAKEIITRFYGEGDGIMGMPPGPATKAAQQNNAIEQMGKGPEGIESFWYASSTKETLGSLIQDNENYLNAGDPDYKKTPVVWDEVDANSSTIKFVYVNAAGNSGPSTLKVSNWKNIDIENPPENDTLEFGKSLTVFIPSAIGLLLILLVLAADSKPSARKHIMHCAVLFGLFAFYMVAKRIGPAVAEMSWLRGEPNGIIQASSLKPTTMLVSAGLLLIFVILCVVSFIQARKEMAAQAKKDKLAKKKESKDTSEKIEEKTVTTSSTKTTSKTTTSSAKVISKGSSSERGSKKDEEKKSSADSEENKGSQKVDETSREKQEREKSGDSKSPKDRLEKSDKDAPSTANNEVGGSSEKKDEDSSTEPKKSSGNHSSSSKEESDESKDSDSKPDGEGPSPVNKESKDALEKKEDSPSEEPKKDDGETKDPPKEGTEEK